jgi:predicted small lipoprotein YifL
MRFAITVALAILLQSATCGQRGPLELPEAPDTALGASAGAAGMGTLP